MSNSLSGDSLYNVLQQAQGFEAEKFFYVGNAEQSGVPGTGDITDLQSFIKNNKFAKAVNVQGILGTDNNKSILSDIFDRPLAATATSYPKSTDGQTTDKTNRPLEQETNKVNIREVLGDRVIINYKNNIVYNLSKDTNLFYNQVNKPAENVMSKFNAEFNPTINTIVSKFGTNESPALKISYADFLYCKKLGNYPNNRLVVLRRFIAPAADDLIESNEMNTDQSPISVMVTWFDEFPMEIDFGEEWKEITTGLISQISNVAKELTGGARKTIKPSEGGQQYGQDASEDIGNPWLSSLWYTFLDNNAKELGLQTGFSRLLPSANPNLIRTARYRAAKSLNSNITFTLKFEYVLRYLNGIDPHIAMHNILANIIRMGTSTSFSVYPKPENTNEGVPKAVEELANGAIRNAIKTVLGQVNEFLAAKNIQITERKQIDNEEEKPAPKQNFTETLDDFSARLFSLYRFKLIAALQADTGMPSGVWHVTVGNPFNPIVTVGDLIIADNIELKFGKELSYNDFPTEIAATVRLKSARNRGSQELEKIFNAGRGRIYVYPTYESNPDTFVNDNSSANTDGTEAETTTGGRESLQNIFGKSLGFLGL